MMPGCVLGWARLTGLSMNCNKPAIPHSPALGDCTTVAFPPIVVEASFFTPAIWFAIPTEPVARIARRVSSFIPCSASRITIFQHLVYFRTN